MNTLGFIGAGRMATALGKGCVEAGLVAANGVLASDPVDAAREKFAAELPGVKLVADNAAVLAGAKTIVLAVKPQMMKQVLAEIHPYVKPEHLLVSIAAGVTLK